jgi:uncharacterized protein YukE
VQFGRYYEVQDGLQSAVAEMGKAAAELRKLTRDHGVYVARAAAEVDSRYVHMAVMTQACVKMDEVADKMENVVTRLMDVWAGQSPPA